MSKPAVLNVWALWDAKWLQEAAAVSLHNTTPYEEWRAGGRASKEWPNKENTDWWAVNGPKMLQSFVDWWQANTNWAVWQTPLRQIGVELELATEFNNIPVRGFADLVCYDQDGILSVVDFKTGSSTPHSGMQLGLYATMIETLYGVRPRRGYFYSARKAMMIPMPDMDRWTRPVFEHLFSKFAQAVDAEIFLPNIGMSCSTCSVSHACFAYSGNIGIDPIGNL